MKSWLRISPAQGRLAGQLGQAAAPRERVHADDRVVAPIGAAAPRHPAEARDHQPPDQRGRELLQAGEQRAALDRSRPALQQRRPRVPVHPADQLHQRTPVHHAVGVEHGHVVVVAAPALAEFGDIAGLAPDVVAPAAVEQLAFRVQLAGHVQPAALFPDPVPGIGGIAQHVEVEQVQAARLADAFVDRLHRREHPVGGFVIDRHQDRGTGAAVRRGGNGGAVRFGDVLGRRSGQPALVHPPDAAGKAEPEGRRDPQHEDGVKHGERDLDGVQPAGVQAANQDGRTGRRGGKDGERDQRPPKARRQSLRGP